MNRFDLASGAHSRLFAQASSRGVSHTTPQEEDLGFLGTLGDIAAAPFRGLEGAVKSIYNLTDSVALDLLPDWDERFLGESQSTAGQFLQGTSQFLAGFIPIAGWVSKGAKVGKLALAPRAITAEGIASAVGKARVLGGLGQGAAAGAVADFALFEGHETRLSNLIQSVPELANPVSEFLAADENDGEIAGRLKNTLEGLGLGLFVDGLMLGLKGVKAGRTAQAEGLDADGIQAAIEEAAPASQIRAAFENPARSFEEEQALRNAPDPDNISEAVEEAARPKGVTPEQDATRVIVETFGVDPRNIKTRAGQIYQIGDVKVNPRTFEDPELLERFLERTNLNTTQWRGERGAIAVIQAFESLYRTAFEIKNPLLQKTTFEKLERESLDELADMLTVTDQQSFMARMQKGIQTDSKDLRGINARIRARKMVLRKTANEYANRLNAQDLGSLGDAELLALKEEGEQLANIVMGVKGLISEQGRGLRGNAMEVRDFRKKFTGKKPREFDTTGRTPKDIEDAINERGGRDKIVKDLMKMERALAENGEKGLIQMSEATRFQKGVGVLTEYWMNSILSGPLTHVVNGTANFMTSVYRPLELLLGSQVNKIFGNSEGQVVKAAMTELSSIVRGVSDSSNWSLAWESAKKNAPILSPNSKFETFAQGSAISDLAKGTDNSTLSSMLHWAGQVVTTPSRALTAGDEFFKQINYRARVNSELLTEATAKGLNPEESARFVAESMENIIKEGQAMTPQRLWNEGLEDARANGLEGDEMYEAAAKYLDEFFDETDGNMKKLYLDISKKALDAAEEATFTNPLRRGQLGFSLQQMVNSHPLLRFVIPFVRTPVNIARFAGQRLDVVGPARVLMATTFGEGLQSLKGSQNRFIQDILSGDARRAAEATGRISMGLGASLFFLQKANEGSISGRGPSDPEQRRILEESGWQPYSFKVGNKWVSYRRFDPFAMVIGTLADMATYGRWARDEDQGVLEQSFNAVMVSLANNFTNKSYLTGVQNFVQAVNDPERFMPRLVQRYGASFIPSAIGQTAGATRDTMPDVRKFTDALMAKIPYYGENVPPVRNILGEAVKRPQALGDSTITNLFLPLVYREVTDDKIKKELASTGHGFTPPRAVRGGVDLREFKKSNGQDAYDRFQELTGQVKVRGRTLRQTLGLLIKSKKYRSLSPEAVDGFNPRANELKRIIARFQREAFRKTLKEFPELRREEARARRNRSALRRGRSVVEAVRGY